jgi:hypothetical protein
LPADERQRITRHIEALVKLSPSKRQALLNLTEPDK